jgi:transcriptional repressor NrdR
VRIRSGLDTKDRPMMCPFCRKGETKVVDSRGSQEFVIRRRRECLECGRRFTTYEKIEESPLKVIKKDGTRVPFDREKIRAGIEKACYKRPVGPEQIERIINDVERDVYENFDREVPSRYIGEKVFNVLRLVDQVAFVRFASVYRAFQDVNDFVEELQPMLRQSRRGRSVRTEP